MKAAPLPLAALTVVLLASVAAAAPSVDPSVPTPKAVLGNEPGADFYLASYDDSLGYFRRLEEASDRVTLVRAGTTSFGLDWWYAVISSPENLAAYDRHREISYRLGRAKGVGEEEARALAREGRAIVHIDGGLHATEAACAQHTIPLAYHLAATRDDPIVDRILGETIFVLWFAMNPDGQNMLVDWYERNLGTPYEVASMPWLYQKYVGHDNNRDGYMQNTIEQQVVSRETLKYQPVVYYNHHQTAPFPARIWIPPFAEPISVNVHPLMWRWVNVFGTQMAAWLDEHRMPGAIHRGDGFDDWYPGFVDHVNSFRNTVSFLTETALYRYATPKFYTLEDFPRSRRDLRAEVFYASPWKGGWWRLGDAVAYMFEASMSVLDTAARYRENLLFNRWQAGQDTIRRFSEGPPYAYVIPQTQHDPGSAAELVRVLQRNGIEVHRATAPFAANGREYHGGDVVVTMDQAFARLTQELLEIQDYPELRQGGDDGPLDLPYDVAGWTLPIQMHVDVHAVTRPLSAGTREGLVRLDRPPWPEGGATGDPAAWGFPRSRNDSVRVVNDVLRAGGAVHVAPDGDFVVTQTTLEPLDEIARKHHVRAEALDAVPDGVTPLKAPRLGLYRPWNPSMDEGWTRWMFDTFGFRPVSLRNEEVVAGGLNDRFDVIVVASMGGRTIRDGFAKGTVPPEYVGGLGDRGVENLGRFVEEGGTLLCFDRSTGFAIEAFDLKVKTPLARAARDEFFCSGSLLRTEVAKEGHPVVAGMPDEPDVMFDRSAVFEPDRGFAGTTLLRWPKKGPILQSGFVIGEEKLRGKAALLEVEHGEGRVLLFGFRPQWRGQPHGTFKLIFNAVWSSVLPREPSDPKETAKSEGAAAKERFGALAKEAHAALEALVDARKEGGAEVTAAAVKRYQGVLSDLDALAGDRKGKAGAKELRAYVSVLRTLLAQAAAADLKAAGVTAQDLVMTHGLDAREKAAKKALGDG